MRIQRLYFLLIFLLFCFEGFSQQETIPPSNLRIKKISTKNISSQIDSLSIIPNTVFLPGIASNDYQIDYANAFIIWKSNSLPDSVTITYRVFPYALHSVSSRLNYDSIRFNFTIEKPYVLKKRNVENKLFDFGNINYNGSFGRGISFGNNQDVIVNSTLNLQLSGFIGDSLELIAAISDNNIPVQPQGNTQNLRDFDRIFMQVKKKGWQASFGDIDIRQQQNYFMNFYKRIQGASFQTVNQFSKNISNSFIASGAIAKGKFTKNNIIALEGNQGPYKLYGDNHELYFAVLGGTEKVFINGELLRRGEDADYIIDYNTAELTFMVKRPITKDSRIQVEFEYSDRNYLNSVIYANDEIIINKKWKFSVGAYSNADAKNTSINQTLTNEQKQFLAEIGNNIDSARYPNAQQDTFSINKILYKKVDTLYNGIHDTVYVYSTNKLDTLYSLSFTPVGDGNGNYVPVSSDANGRVFKWIAPINGIRQGSWDPAILLITPKKHQLISTTAQYNFTDKSFLRAQLAASDYDINTFSSKDKNNNTGTAGKIDYVNEMPIFKNLKKGIVLKSEVGYEFVEKTFKSIEPLRQVEFNRDWGLPYYVPSADEHLINAAFQIEDQKNNFIKYQFTNYNRSDNYNGYRNSLENKMTWEGWDMTNIFYLTTIQSANQKGTFFRPTIDINRTFSSLKNLNIGAGFSSENNQQLNTQFDTLMPVSFGFTIWKVYVKSDETKPNKWSIIYLNRENKIPYQKGFITSDKSQNIGLNWELLKSEKHQFRLNATYRKLQVLNSSNSNLKSDESILGRAEYAVNEWNGFITGSVLYELGTGQEQKREYTYVEVPTGQGYYKWVDYNKDGIPQLNEFEIAVFQDEKKWIRVFTPTNQFIKANYIQFNYNFSLNPASIISNKTSSLFLKLLTRFSSASALQIQKKNIAQGSFDFNPFENKLNDTSLISLYSFLSNTLYFNRRSSVWGVDFTHRLSNTKSLLNYGFESNSRRDMTIKGRWNLNKSFSTSLTNKLIKLELITPAFLNRNYLIKEISLEPSVSYIYKTDFRISLMYTYDSRKNTILQMEKAINHSLTAEMRYNVLSSGTINGRFSLNNISFTGEPSSTVGYVLLDGLLPGKNYLWNIELTKKIAGNIELNLQYEGRKSGNVNAIHTGRASLRAIF